MLAPKGLSYQDGLSPTITLIPRGKRDAKTHSLSIERLARNLGNGKEAVSKRISLPNANDELKN